MNIGGSSGLETYEWHIYSFGSGYITYSEKIELEKIRREKERVVFHFI